MKILIISQYFPPEPELKISGLAKGLSELGHQVTVLTGYPNYPSGEIYEGFSVTGVSREPFGLADVVRLPLIPDKNRKAIWRIFKLYEFYVVSFFL